MDLNVLIVSESILPTYKCVDHSSKSNLQLNGLVFLSGPLIPVSRTVTPWFTELLGFFTTCIRFHHCLNQFCSTIAALGIFINACAYTVIYTKLDDKLSHF